MQLKSIYNVQESSSDYFSTIWEIPVCYDDELGTDINQFSEDIGLTKSEIIALHSKQIYTVFFIGFLPGFLYLGGLDSKLFLDRKSTPNLDVKKGAVGIGGKQTGIYPENSPGGWHIIGNSPVEIFNPNCKLPCKIKAGDKVKFIPISKNDYDELVIAIQNLEYQLTSKKQKCF